MRMLAALIMVAACGGPAYRLEVTDTYEVGEDATVALRVREVSDADADVVITRPDGTEVRQHAPLDAEVTRVRFSPPVPRPRAIPTFTVTGEYTIELQSRGKTLARRTVHVTVDRLADLIPDEIIADYKPITRFTRAKQAGTQHWKTYGATYEHPSRTDARIDLLIEEPGASLETAWKPYKEGAPLAVVLDHTVRFRERTGGVQASWISGDLIVVMKAPTLADLEQGLIGHFLDRFPSKLSAK